MSKRLLYEYRNEGTRLPRISSCKVFDDGEVVLEDGYLYDPSQWRKTVRKISKESIHSIKEAIERNHSLFDTKELDYNCGCMLDGTITTLTFANESQRNKFEIYDFDFFYRENHRNSFDASRAPKFNLVLRVYEEIRDILVANGIAEEYC